MSNIFFRESLNKNYKLKLLKSVLVFLRLLLNNSQLIFISIKSQMSKQSTYIWFTQKVNACVDIKNKEFRPFSARSLSRLFLEFF
jgi:hypothetical protein